MDLNQIVYAKNGNDRRSIAAMRACIDSRMSRETATRLYYDLLGRPLLQDEADALEALALALGKEVKWQHCHLLPTLSWEDGRKG